MEGTMAWVGASPDPDEVMPNSTSTQPSLRRITSIQVRNLSPFPARDSLASSLTQRSPVAPSTSGAGSVLASDDSDIIIGQRSKRRISSASIHTLKGVTHSDRENDFSISHDASKVLRRRTNSRVSVRAVGKKSSSPSAKRQAIVGSAEILHKDLIISETALSGDSAPSWDKTPLFSSSSWLTSTLNSQRQLEEAIWSRLVVTFLTISLPQHDGYSPISASPDVLQQTSQCCNGRNIQIGRSSGSMHLKHSVQSLSSPIRHSRRSASVSDVPTTSLHQYTISPSIPTFVSAVPDTTPKTFDSPHRASFPQSPPLTPIASSSSSHVPIFMSPFHRASTNPRFVLDPEEATFARWADLSTERVIIQLWAKSGRDLIWPMEMREKRKGKEKSERNGNHDDRGESTWRVLCEWIVRLSDLVPLPEDLNEHPWELPANTLILTLSPSNKPFYIPSTLLGATSPGRPEPPSYNSDTEVSRRQPLSKTIFSDNRGRQRRSRRQLKSASLNELVKLASLHASLLDTQNLLKEVVENCNRLIEEDSGAVLLRESSERKYRLQCLQEQREVLDDRIKLARDDITSRRQRLSQRQIRLAEARALHEDDSLSEFDAGVRLAEERRRVQDLRDQIKPVQTSLLSILGFVFPIELLSPPDLLYTILGVPLPIPLQGTDPAPPLSMPHEPDVTEDGVATALGYAALLVHLMAAYLCQRLVYPITYVGSRSLVKDPISAMMGPRMFPLYSKGVDTYRFEYAVFLLNKDIEMLMAERNLRALDLRHTLPNLKNLLLTLTSGEGALPISYNLYSPSVVSITPGLQSPCPHDPEAMESGNSDPSPLSLAVDDAGSSTTPKGRAVVLPSVDDGMNAANLADIGNKIANGNMITSSDPALSTSDASLSSMNEDRSGTSSGSSTLRPRLPRIQIQSYLGLAPLSSMWRGRGTSSSAAPSTQPGEAERSSEGQPSDTAAPFSGAKEESIDDTEDGSESNEEQDEDEEDDRCTVRGPSAPTTPIPETRSRRGSIAPEGLLDNLKARVHLRGGGGTSVSSETEKRSDSVNDRDAVVDPAC